jgi:hypothetical protein
LRVGAGNGQFPKDFLIECARCHFQIFHHRVNSRGHCGIFKEWRFDCTAYLVRPNIRATTASGLLPSSSNSRLECGAGASLIPHPGFGQRDGVHNQSIFPSAKRLNVGGNADSAGDETFATGAQLRSLI